ncbi:hypothetical protein M5689_000813 [Euphorbia peplus]|nr:hypothetical protein M5689_000813 [Euphorbia peplus]
MEFMPPDTTHVPRGSMERMASRYHSARATWTMHAQSGRDAMAAMTADVAARDAQIADMTGRLAVLEVEESRR